MKKITVSALALLAAVAVTNVAHADTMPGWYVGAGVGATFPVDPKLHMGRAGGSSARDEDVNLDALANGGYAWSNGLRLEGEYFHNQVNTVDVHSLAAPGGHVTNNALFANALYDFQTGTMFTPYVGAGVGPDFVNVKSVGAAGIGYLKGDTLALGYQGIAGVSAQVAPNWAVTADYRYIASLDPKVDATAGGQGRLDNASHNVIVGVRYNFDTPEAAPAPMHTAAAPYVAPHPTARTAVAPVAASFTVFFDFNKSVLTPEAKRIIASAAQEFKRAGYASIDVTGHTDTSGKATYNQKLSERRALAVTEELNKLGVATQNIKKTGVGEDGLLVPTAQGVREAQNRRAEIVLAK